ncbi:tetratricopeptide repeat protein [Nitrospirales bacterium NOB]|nr:tetratricopeptide repeat protein [Nitrospira sp. NTP2]MCK6492295.1 tetratricopeptide repeat protein [Nitrospira sp.]MDL1890019.1 tetratricopeptide repeat protein [Nitrospirales bacterium NOB]MEB2338018.1 tetratricopeptide repeat protein [Nitrospirales bacterium]QOJ36344.1 MAG: tetratricopeptide repeat protein [Nitrospira sp.]
MRLRGHQGGGGWLLLAVGLLSFSACANEENLRKSKGFYQEGVARLSSDQQQAYVSFQKAVKLNPDNKEAHYGLGHIYAMQGRFKLAEESFRDAIRVDGDYAEAYTYLGQVLANQGRWKDAIAAYRQALSNPLYPTPDLARFQLGKALRHEGDLQGAMETLEDATTVTPPNVPPALLQLELGRVYHDLGFDDKAREALSKVSALDKGGEQAAAAQELLGKLKP